MKNFVVIEVPCSIIVFWVYLVFVISTKHHLRFFVIRVQGHEERENIIFENTCFNHVVKEWGYVRLSKLGVS